MSEVLSKVKELFANIDAHEKTGNEYRQYIERARRCFDNGICPSCGSNNVVFVDAEFKDERSYKCNSCAISVYINTTMVKT